ncbi:hypothetical protein Tco_1368416 [Tanacetum coccineum]
MNSYQAYENFFDYKEKNQEDTRCYGSKKPLFNVGDRVPIHSRLKIFLGQIEIPWLTITVVHVFPYGTVELSQIGTTFKGNGHRIKITLEGKYHEVVRISNSSHGPINSGEGQGRTLKALRGRHQCLSVEARSRCGFKLRLILSNIGKKVLFVFSSDCNGVGFQSKTSVLVVISTRERGLVRITRKDENQAKNDKLIGMEKTVKD